MSITLFLHIFSVGIWFGCANIEIILEFMRRRDSSLQYAVAKFHYYIDIFVEVPAIIIILVTGFLLLDMSEMSALRLIKVVCGFLAILATMLSVVIVFRRRYAVDADNRAAVDKNDKLFDIIAYAIVAPLLNIALWIGLYFVFFQ